ncbi:AGAP005249-PA-like protein [Anopheles sinensis]|uniref:AGAP005249-PA-like protein n=1 Tax=Anopheles sinensis TaxID=74873 RepID=A0A084WRT6_ANOSI|nr:AGAP005249-PA-like protein [Anopheles sinensis]
MSRIIIKNIPNGFDETKLRNHFSTCGIITDVQLKYTPEGKFRNFGFIGYENEDQATKAIKHFNNTFIRTSKISVAPCVALSETKNLKVWSKHSKQQEEKAKQEQEGTEAPEKEKSKPLTAKDVLGRHENDPLFQEYLDAHKRPGKAVWDNQFQHAEPESQSAATDRKASSEDSAIEADDSPPPAKTKESTESKEKPKKDLIPLFVAKLNNIPINTKRQDVIRFFKTTKPYSVRIPRNSKGFAYVGFKTESELKKALLMNKSFLGGKQVKIYDFTAQNGDVSKVKEEKRGKEAKWERQRMNQSSETICESGKLFFRNLAYSVKEEDIRELFERYGPVVEVDVPIDSLTRKVKGFGTATFLMPEHAVVAYNELNGTFLQGRMFHILPAIVKNDEQAEEEATDGTNFKKKKEQLLKKTAQSSHNWNTLFMGENAVAEAVARKYDTTKEQVLISADGTGSTSAAVRLALGETEIVLEMQKFLEENGIRLDSFESSNGKRSNTVILAKNLAPGCTVQDLRRLFAPFGILGRVVMPPSAVTAVIEFLDPSEARKAFKKLAYTVFQSLPLYLEWAPENTFKSAATEDELKRLKEEETTATSEPPKTKAAAAIEDPVDDTEPEEGTTLFIKNLSFSTTEDAIRERFRNVGAIHSVQIVRSKDLSGTGQNESRGYGFIQFKLRKSADHALKNLQFAQIDGRTVELARSDRTLKSAHDAQDGRKSAKAKKQTGSKILVRNIPFQANAREVRDLFKVFGDIQSLRLPKKMAAGADESHRGFCFVDFVQEPDAKRAFETLSRSTHLYGRRLVLEWAAPEDGVDELRKRTAEHFEGSSSKRPNNRKGALMSEEFVSVRNTGNGDDDYMDDDGGAF